MLHVTEDDVKGLLPFAKAIELVRGAYVKLARGEAINPPRVLLSVPGGASMFFMPGHMYGQGSVAVKVARVNAENPKVSLPTVLLTIYAYDATTGVQVAEVDTELVKRSRVVVDSRAQALTTYGDIVGPIREGAIRESEILELGEIMIGKIKAEHRAGDLTLFKSGGLAILDAMITDHILRQLSRRKGPTRARQ